MIKYKTMRTFITSIALLGLIAGCATPPPVDPLRLRESWLSPFRREWIREDPLQSYSLLRTANHRRLHEDSIRFELRENELGAQILTQYSIPAHEERWYGMSIYLNGDFPVDDTLVTLLEWKSASGSDQEDLSINAPISLRLIHGEMSLWLKEKKIFQISQNFLGRWIDLQFRVKWSELHDGAIQFWLSDRLVFDYQGKISAGIDENSVLKFGIHRNKSTQKMIVYFNELRQGKSASEVKPEALPLR